MRLLVTGSRYWRPLELVSLVLGKYRVQGIDQLIEGCDPTGIDWTAGHMWAPSVGIEPRHFPADWDTHHRAAGPIRNSHMLANLRHFAKGEEVVPLQVVAFSQALDKSKGTRDMVLKSMRAKVPVLLVEGWVDEHARIPWTRVLDDADYRSLKR